MVIYEVRNKVFSALFESELDARQYWSEHGTAANGLNLHEVYVIDDSQKAIVKNKKEE